MGEYARSLAIARALESSLPGAQLHFLLSRAAPYAAGAPYPHTLLPASPTLHSAKVVECMRSFRPDLVIFDNAGRTAQLREARRLGARVVFISARNRQRRKAFRLRWMRLIDEHWIAYPQFIVGRPGRLQALKLRMLGRPRLRYLDVIVPPPEPSRRGTLLDAIGFESGHYTLIVPGGGTGHPGAESAPARFLDAARALAAAGRRAIYVGPSAGDGDSESPDLKILAKLPQPDLAELMRGATLVVANGGSTLLQAIATGAPCIAVPIAGDQAARIRSCAEAGVAIAAPPESSGIAQAAEALLRDDATRIALGRRAAALGLADGIDVALRAVRGLLRP